MKEALSMSLCTLCQEPRRTFTVYLIVREAARLSGWKARVCDECLAPWGNGVAMGGVAVMRQEYLYADGGPPEAGG